MLAKRKIFLQAVIWSVFYVLLLVYSYRGPDLIPVNITTATSTLLFCAISSYLNYWLLKRSVHIQRTGLFMLILIAATITLVLLKCLNEYLLVYVHFEFHHFYNFSLGQIAFSLVIMLIGFLFGYLLFISTHYELVKKRERDLLYQQTISELNRLKTQVQPHFLFNTLNNIYSLAVSQSEKTAETVARLANIMRYFLHDASQNHLPIAKEIQFIRNYIELEALRLKEPEMIILDVDLEDEEIEIPPMLLIPFVENIFKHGSYSHNHKPFARIHIFQKGNILKANVINSKTVRSQQGITSGIGVANVRQRLQILFPGQHNLEISDERDTYAVNLNIQLNV